MTLNICHLYPDLMDTYGDMGNIITIIKRCQWRGIKVDLKNVSIGDPLPTDDFSARGGPASGWDLFFFGGGQDKAQTIVSKDLKLKAKGLKAAIENGAVLLSICGGYQLLQNYFKTKEDEKIQGIGLFNAHTVGSNDRMIQNLLIEINPQLQSEIQKNYQTLSLRVKRSNLNLLQDRHTPLAMTKGVSNLVGFENHSGKTSLGKNAQPLGTVLKGAGNNGEDKTEGAIYKNAFGCYLHGSLLPKNPHFADFLIAKALQRRYGIVRLKPLDDTIEWQAHKSAIIRTQS